MASRAACLATSIVILTFDTAVAQQPVATGEPGQGQEIEEIITTGTRAKGRTAIESNVPIDVFQAEELLQTPSPDLKDALAAVSPSYYVERNSAADQDSMQRETTLRGLDGGEVLVLVNGKRVHRSAIVNKNGVHAANIATFSTNAIKSVEVLRDGASAMYGADAVAGVFNFILDDYEGASVQAGYSQYYEGDGAYYGVSGKLGSSIGDRGFVTVTGGYNEQDSTNRTLTHLGAAAMVADGARRGVEIDVNPDTIFPFGISATRNLHLGWNAAFEISDKAEIYTFGNYADMVNIQPLNFRENLYCNGSASNPAHPGLRHCSEIPELRFKDGSVGGPPSPMNPTRLTQAQLAEQIGADAAARFAYLLADGPNATSTNGAEPVGYDPKIAFPNGYQGFIHTFGVDLGGYLGIRGEIGDRLSWDLSGSAGRSRVTFENNNTQNPSMGAPMALDGSIDYENVQKNFYAGGTVNLERTLSADFVYDTNVQAIENLFVSFGLEYRSEQYYSIIGEENSWQVGPLVDLSVGSNGFTGYSPQSMFDESRNNYAGYIDFDAQITDSLNISAAARYEDFSDFGDNLSGKISARYQIVDDRLALRGSVSTGFHAPSLGQINTLRLTSAFRAGEINYGGIFPASHPLPLALGSKPLVAEEAENYSAGFVLTPGDQTSLTVDFFRIDVDDRIRLSQRFRASDPRYADIFQAFIDSGFPGAAFLTDVQWFGNGVDTRTTGFELVGTHNISFAASDLLLTLAYSQIDTEVKAFDPAVSDDETNFNLEHYVVPRTATASVRYLFGDFDIGGRVRWWDTRETAQGFLNEDGSIRIDENPGRAYVDLSVRYRATDHLSLVVGADNLLNEYPASLPDLIESSNRRGRQYVFPGPDWQGGSYYARVSYEF